MEDNLPLLVFSGPSGVGKGTFLKKFMEEFSENCEMSVSWTTRDPRVGETDGKEYHFKNREEFEQEERNGMFVEVSNNYGRKYGTNKAVLNKIIAGGKIPVLEVDVEAGQKIHHCFPKANFIFFNVKNSDSLKERMKKRGTETDDLIEKRFKKGELEIQEFKRLDFYKEILNEDLETCYQETVDYIASLYHGFEWERK